MKLTYKVIIPLEHIVEKIVKNLNELTDISAISSFKNEIPRGFIIEINIPDNSSHQDVLEIGALIGTIESIK